MALSKRFILAVIVIAQFCCTSLWFASNGVMSDLISEYQLPGTALGHLTSAVQFGFICGTLLFALFTIADRYSPSKVFVISALLAAACNSLTIMESNTLPTLLILRFLTGFFLAGIYPVGMKIAADYFSHGLGKSLGFLVGALVVGTASSHLLKALNAEAPWPYIILGTSFLAVLGGLMIGILVPDGPHRKPSQGFNFSAVYSVFKNTDFRAAAFGYFGHMWELYAFWTFVPYLLTIYAAQHTGITINIPLWSFIIIGSGGLSCVLGGYLSEKTGIKNTAGTALLLSGLCCLASPVLMDLPSENSLLYYLLFWGLMVIADSPLFSTIVAQNAPGEFKGTALTIVNCIGFSITIASIEIITLLLESYPSRYVFTILAIGPILGLWSLFGNRK